MEITIKLGNEEIEDRLRRYIYGKVWENWDWGMTLAESEEAGAHVPGMSETRLRLKDEVRYAVEETLEEGFDEGWPHGGMPEELHDEIEAHLGKVMKKVTKYK